MHIGVDRGIWSAADADFKSSQYVAILKDHMHSLRGDFFCKYQGRELTAIEVEVSLGIDTPFEGAQSVQSHLCPRFDSRQLEQAQLSRLGVIGVCLQGHPSGNCSIVREALLPAMCLGEDRTKDTPGVDAA